MGKLADRLMRDAVTWRPDKADKELGPTEDNAPIIEGRIVAIDHLMGQYGEYPLTELETEDGQLARVHWLGQILENEWGRRQPVEGDDVAIRYLGKQQGRTQEYIGYRVAHQRNTPRPAPAAQPVPVPSGPPPDFEPF